MTEEQWRPVVGYEGLYEVSDQGRVRSLDRIVPRVGGRASGRPVRLRGTIRRLHPARDGGYPAVSLCREGKQRTWTVHRLIMEAFVGPPPEGMEIRHLDGNAWNSQLGNLRYGTSSENTQDIIAHGRDSNLRKTHCPRGHAYVSENIYSPPSNPRARNCRACVAIKRHRAKHQRLGTG